MAKTTNVKLVANNKKAYHDYFILETFEAGIALSGTEVKSIRMGKCSIKEAFVRVEKGEVFIYGMHISPYEKGNIFNKDPLRVRKLLLHRSEINKLQGEKIDAAFVPVDPRLGEQYCWGIDCFMKRTDTKYVFPMHFWGSYDVYERLMLEPCTRDYRERIMKIGREGQSFLLDGSEK